MFETFSQHLVNMAVVTNALNIPLHCCLAPHQELLVVSQS